MQTRLRSLLVLTSVGVLSAGCGPARPPATPTPVASSEPLETRLQERKAVDPPVLAAAGRLYRQRCALCHGLEGRGNGPQAPGLPEPPRNYRDLAWQREVTDEEIMAIIVGGGPSVGKSPQMPANPDLESRQELLHGLVAVIRRFGRSSSGNDGG